MEKRYAPQILKVVNVDRENYKIRFVFSTKAVDRHGEVIDQSGWKLDNYLLNPVVLWGHDQSQFPIGKSENMSNVGQLEGDVVFAYKENPQAAIALELCAGGFLNAGSVGFMNNKWMYDETTDTLTLLENELYEFSIVNVPANPQALAKAVDDMRAKNVDKTVIDNVIAFQMAAKEAAENRFKNLGEQVNETEEAVEVPADEEPEEKPDSETDPENVLPTEEEKAAEKAANDEAIKAAIELLVNSSPEQIKNAVATLADKLQAADTTEKSVDTTPAPQDRVKKYSVNDINRTIRFLMNGTRT